MAFRFRPQRANAILRLPRIGANGRGHSLTGNGWSRRFDTLKIVRPVRHIVTTGLEPCPEVVPRFESAPPHYTGYASDGGVGRRGRARFQPVFTRQGFQPSRRLAMIGALTDDHLGDSEASRDITDIRATEGQKGILDCGLSWFRQFRPLTSPYVETNRSLLRTPTKRGTCDICHGGSIPCGSPSD